MRCDLVAEGKLPLKLDMWASPTHMWSVPRVSLGQVVFAHLSPFFYLLA